MSTTPRSPAWNVVWWLSTRVGLPLILLCLILWATVDMAARQVLGPFSWYAEVSYASVFWRFNGEVGIDDLTLRPYGAEDESETIHVDHVTVTTPGFLWLLKAAFHDAKPKARGGLGRLRRAAEKAGGGDEPEGFPPADRLAVTFDNLTFGGENVTLGEDLDWLGFASAAPYEAAGCGEDEWWDAQELLDMGLPPNPVRLTFGYEVLTDSMVRVHTRLEREGSSSAELASRYKVEDAKNFFDIDWDKAITFERRWTIADDGFIAHRNTFCARREGLKRGEFVDRHVAAVERLLLADGVVAPPAVLAVYRRYVTRGGEVVWESKPTTTIPDEQLHHYAKADRVRMLNATLRASGMDPVPFELTFVEPVPLPGAAPEQSLEEQLEAELRAERAATLPAAPAPPAAPTQPDAAAPQPEPAPSGPASKPETGTRVASTAAPTSAKPAPPDVAPAPRAPRVFTDGSALSTPTRAAPPAAPGVAPPAPATNAPLASAAPLAAAGTPLAYEDVAKYVGRTITVETIYKSRRTGVVEKHNNGAITLRVNDRGAPILLTLPRPTIERIVAGAGRTTTARPQSNAQKN